VIRIASGRLDGWERDAAARSGTLRDSVTALPVILLASWKMLAKTKQQKKLDKIVRKTSSWGRLN
jgi:hypothetical protein